MEELTRLQASRKGYRSHVTRIFNKADDAIGRDVDEFSVTYLKTAVDQLQKKKELIHQIDERIAELVQTPDELEGAICEAEELQDSILEKINELQKHIELKTKELTGMSIPCNENTTTSSDVEPEDTDTSSQCLNSNAPSISTTSNSSSLAPTYTIASSDPTVPIEQTLNQMSLHATTTSTTTVSYTHSSGPPLLIPTSPFVITSSSMAPQGLSTSHYYGMYEPPQLTTLSYGDHHGPLVSVIPPTNLTQTNENRRGTQQFVTSRLPKLTLPSFSGDPLQWQSFWDSFCAAIHSNPNLSGVQKFNYLKAQLQGDAARTIAGLPLTELNYRHSITLLHERFGQTHKLINAHMQALLEMPSPTNSVASLRMFHDSIENHTRGLSSLGKSEGTYGDLLVPIILAKLSQDIRQNLARENTSPEWTLPELMSAILKEIRILESGLCDSHKAPLQFSTATFHIGSQDAPSDKKQHTNKKRHPCLFCKGPHPPHTCTVVTDHQKRLDIVKRDNLCFNCLAHHKVSHCTSKYRCRRCQRKHHTSLCSSEPSKNTNSGEAPKTNITTNTSQQGPVSAGTHIVPASNQNSQIVTTYLLKTAIAPVIAGNIKTTANILFDEGAQRSFITTKLAAELQIIPTITEQVALSSFGANARSCQELGVATIQVETNTGDLIPISVLIVPSIAVPIQNSSRVSLDSIPHLQGLKLAHPITTDHNFQVSLLIGTDHYWSFIQDHIVRGEGPTAQQSKLGYLLSGPLPYLQSNNQLSSSVMLQINTTITESQDPDLQAFWSVETAAISTDKLDNTNFLQAYQSMNILLNSNGTYTAKFPWKADKSHLPSNFNICKRRTVALVNKLRQSPELLQLYTNILKEQEKCGFIERVTDNNTTDNVHYLPHHPVKKESPTTPIRIVYDCSCRESGNSVSLNDCLMVGPPFLNDLCAILLRFRLHPFALSTDIEKAFLQVQLHQSDRDYTRFLWPSQPERPTSKLHIYRFAVVPFGTASSPFMLNATINLHLSKFQCQVATDIQQNIYVDNVLSGCNTETEILQYYIRARSIMGQAGFNLRSWSSNSNSLCKVTADDKTIAPNTSVNILGLRWNTATDTLSLTPKMLPSGDFISKRDVLQGSSQIYDPLGWTTPVTIKAKILLQEVWQRRTSWDEPLDKDLHDRWLTLCDDILTLPTLTIPRTYFSPSLTSVQINNMYVFTDASTKAYGAVIYLNKANQICLTMSKSRVAPVKTLTLPKLELMAAVIGTRLAKFVLSSILPHNSEPPIRVHLWSDSQIVLHWIHKNNTSKPFVSHRVTEIVASFPAAMWSYTPSSDNPADLLTRGVSTQQLMSSDLWTHGPKWLLKESSWPTWVPTNLLHLQAAEDTESDVIHNSEPTSKTYQGMHNIVDVSQYSHIQRVLAVTAYVLRFVHNLHKFQPYLTGPLTAEELKTAHNLLLKDLQHLSYQQELNYLLKKQSQCPTLVKQLRLFLDDSKMIRCGGRIHNAPTSDLTKFPYLLPPKHPLTNLIVMDTHKRLHHTGVSNTVTALRQVYWIPAIRQNVRKLLRQCVICNKLLGKPYRAPDPPPLPKVRVNECPPFSVTGVDFTGALYVRDRGEERKVYICLFTCAATRAVHLEIVLDLSVESFLLAFRRFASRKSLPRKMLSDNASTYLAAAEDLQKLFKSDILKETLGRQNITWQFIPKRAPWYGGFWERLIGLTKQAVKKTLGRAFITLPQLETMVVEIEAMLNDRPLTYVSSDISDPEPLTPSHLMYGRRLQSVPHPFGDSEEEEDPTYASGDDMRKQVDRHEQLIRHFWVRWKKEYLTSLREFNKVTTGHNKQVIRKGDIVIIHDDKPRLQWKLAVVEDLIKGNDGLVRAAHIKTENYRTTRPIVKLYPLEVSSGGDEDATDATRNNNMSEDTSNMRKDTISRDTGADQITSPRECVRRKAATRALQRMSEWADVLGGPPEDVEN